MASKKILVVGSPVYAELFDLFGITTTYREGNGLVVADYDIIAFTGGPDLNPSLYGEYPHYSCRIDHSRDREEVTLVKRAFAANITCVGICRGGQLLSVMNGDTLVQDCNNHLTGNHCVYYNDTTYYVNSTHHQMMVADKGYILAYADEATEKKGGDYRDIKTIGTDPEAVWYEQTKSLCVQFHPERTYCTGAFNLFSELMEEYVL